MKSAQIWGGVASNRTREANVIWIALNPVVRPYTHTHTYAHMNNFTSIVFDTHVCSSTRYEAYLKILSIYHSHSQRLRFHYSAHVACGLMWKQGISVATYYLPTMISYEVGSCVYVSHMSLDYPTVLHLTEFINISFKQNRSVFFANWNWVLFTERRLGRWSSKDGDCTLHAHLIYKKQKCWNSLDMLKLYVEAIMHKLTVEAEDLICWLKQRP